MDADGAPSKLTIDTFTEGPITCLRLSGIIDENFDGKRLAATVKGRTVVLHLGEIRRISSFGIREWIDFINGVARNTADIIFVACAPKVIDQLNMVANFIGPGRVFSLYAPYRCDFCDTEDRVLLQMDRDHESIKNMKPAARACPSCGEPEYFDEDPPSYFSYLAGQPYFELEPAVLAMLASKLGYAVSDGSRRRLTVDKQVAGRCTFIALSGDMDASFPRSKLAEGVEGMVVLDLAGLGRIDPAGAAEWRSFMQMISPTAEAIYLIGVPPLFLEKLTSSDDLGDKAKVASMALPYTCNRCVTTTLYAVSADDHFDLLKFATPPELLCRECREPLRCAATEAMMSYVATLPKPTMPADVRAAMRAAKERMSQPRLALGGAGAGVAGAGATGRSNALLVIAAAVLAAVLTAGGIIGYRYLADRAAAGAQAGGVGTLLEASQSARPAWMRASEPLSAYCDAEAATGLSCVGISSYTETEAEAREQAENAALEAVADAVFVRISEPSVIQSQSAMFGTARDATIMGFAEVAKRDPDSFHHERARRALISGRNAVARALRKTAGELIPTAAAAVHWERYAASPGPGSRYLFMIRYDLSADEIERLLERYSTTRGLLGGTVATVYPGIAWRYSAVQGGVVIVALGDGELKSTGLSERYIILAVQEREIKDADAFENILSDELQRLGRDGGQLRLRVKTGDGEPIDFTLPVAKSVDDGIPVPPSTGRLPGPVNTWDRVGGN